MILVIEDIAFETYAEATDSSKYPHKGLYRVEITKESYDPSFVYVNDLSAGVYPCFVFVTKDVWRDHEQIVTEAPNAPAPLKSIQQIDGETLLKAIALAQKPELISTMFLMK